jgi:septum formation protein
MSQVYLASKSPRRLELLKQIGITPIVLDCDVPEIMNANESAIGFASRIALCKAEAGQKQIHSLAPVIGADTIAVLDNKILGKPRDKNHGIEMLKLLSGNTHQVITAVAITNGNLIKQCVVENEVSFAHLTPEEIESYWETGEPCDKAGAYAIQGKAAAFITYLKGSYSAVVGLPLYETLNLLGEFGIQVL